MLTWYELLKPGGAFVAQVGLDDHLAHGDASKSKKEYLRFSKSIFKKWLQSDLQYINRIPASTILKALDAAGFVVELAERETIALDHLPVHADYADQSPEDRATVRLLFKARKPTAV